MPGIIGSTGWDRSNAWTWDFSSTHSTRACSGGSRYSPTTSRTLSMNCGSELSLKVSARCGLSRNAFQIRPTVDFDSPERLAIDARDQCVASLGVSSKVATTTASTCPANRPVMNLARHLVTVWGQTPSFAATALFVEPYAQARTIPHRNGHTR